MQERIGYTRFFLVSKGFANALKTFSGDFNTMDFLEGILAGSGYYICESK